MRLVKARVRSYRSIREGMVTAYKIQRRKRDGGSWMEAGMAVETETLLSDQESGVEFEYRVLAVNKLGEGPPSNVVRAVL